MKKTRNTNLKPGTASKVANKQQTKLMKQGKVKPKNGSKFSTISAREKNKYASKMARSENGTDSNGQKPKKTPQNVRLSFAAKKANAKKMRQQLSMPDKEVASNVNNIDVDDIMGMMPKQKQQKQLKRKHDESDESEESDLEEYEKAGARRTFAKPSVSGAILVTKAPNSSDKENDNDAVDALEDHEEEPLSLVELLVQRKHKFEEIKERVGNLATSIITYPERNILMLKSLLSLLDVKDNDPAFKLAFVQVHMLLACSCLEVFKDILPLYRVKENLIEHKDKNNRRVKHKKETQKLRDYEMQLIKYYKVFIHRMERMINCNKKNRTSHFYDDMVESTALREKLSMVGVKCLCHMIATNPHFNFRDQVINIVAVELANKNEELSTMCCEAFISLFKQDRLGEITLSAVKAIGRVIKDLGLKTEPRVIDVFLALRIREVRKKDPMPKDMKLVRGKLELLSRKEKKRNKKIVKLDNQLLETEAQESYKKKLEYNTEVLTQLFYIFFRLLKQVSEKGLKDEESAKCLTPILRGLSRYCHLINVDFYDDLMKLLYKLVDTNRLSNSQALYCLHVVFVLLSNDGYALNIDPQRFYGQLYKCLLNIDCETMNEDEDMKLIQKCIESMIIQRRKQITVTRAQAFCKRLSTIAAQCPTNAAASVLSSLRPIIKNHSQCDVMLDTEATGSGLFLPHLDDPEHSNAGSTKLWELHTLRKHCEPLTRRFAHYLMSGMSSSDLNIELLKLSSANIHELVMEKDGEFLDSVDRPQPLKRRLHGYVYSASSMFSREIENVEPFE